MADSVVGPHKHVLIIQLQKEFHSRTGYWMPTEKLWEKVHDVWDVAGLEGLVSLRYLVACRLRLGRGINGRLRRCKISSARACWALEIEPK